MLKMAACLRVILYRHLGGKFGALYRVYLGIMEKEMEASIWGLGFR